MSTDASPPLASPLTAATAAHIETLLRAELGILERLEACCAAQLASGSGQQPVAAASGVILDGLENIQREHQALERQREKTLTELRKFSDEPVRLSRLIARAPAPHDLRLAGLRQALLDRMVRVRSMTLAAQLALAWQLDHYRQLYAEIAGVTPEPCSFEPGGRPVPSQSTPQMIEDC